VEERERIARLIAGALHAGRENDIVTIGSRQIAQSVFAVPPKEFQAPLWSLYTTVADVIIGDQERQAEAARERWAAASPEID
jgi:hypothetical protein